MMPFHCRRSNLDWTAELARELSPECMRRILTWMYIDMIELKAWSEEAVESFKKDEAHWDAFSFNFILFPSPHNAISAGYQRCIGNEHLRISRTQ